MKDWIEKQRETVNNADPELAEKIRLRRLELGYVAPTTYSSGRKIEDGDEMFYGLVLNNVINNEKGLDISYKLVNFPLDEIGSVYEINNILTDVSISTLPFLIKIENWVTKQREVVKSINDYNNEHPEFFEARKNLGLSNEIKLNSGKILKENSEYFYGGLLDDNQKDTDKFTFMSILFILDEIGVEYVVNEKYTNDLSLYPMLNKIIKE